MSAPVDGQPNPITENSIYRDLQAAERYVRETYERSRIFVIITGLPGIGKSSIVRRVCQEFGRKWAPIKPGTVGGFIDLLRRNRFEGIVLVGDDTTDALWDSNEFLNLLKSAYDTQHDRVLRHDVLGNHKVSPFPIKSALILISNIDFYSEAAKTRFGKKWPHVQAVLTRATLVNLTFDNHRDLYEYACWVGVEQQMLKRVYKDQQKLGDSAKRRLYLPRAEGNEVLQLFREEARHWRGGLTPRTLESIGRARIGVSRDVWIADCHRTLMSTETLRPPLRDLPLYEIPQPVKTAKVKASKVEEPTPTTHTSVAGADLRSAPGESAEPVPEWRESA